jgi:nucleotide-binding universal stress UspA family protein
MDAQHADLAVVVGIDGSRSALRAMRWAAIEATRRKAPLRLVTAYPVNQPPFVGRRGGSSAELAEVVREVARRQLAEAAAIASASVPTGVEVHWRLIGGAPVAALRAAAEQAQLLVLGDRGRGAVAGLLAGSVAIGVSAHAACPVVLVRTGKDEAVEDRIRPIVVGIDGSPVSENALAFAFNAASVRGVPLVAVHTWSDLYVDETMATQLNWSTIQPAEAEVLAERLAGWGEKYPDVPVTRRVALDRPARALVTESREAQLVVVGSRGRGQLVGRLLGSVSHAVVHRAHCSVAVVPPPADDGS